MYFTSMSLRAGTRRFCLFRKMAVFMYMYAYLRIFHESLCILQVCRSQPATAGTFFSLKLAVFMYIYAYICIFNVFLRILRVFRSHPTPAGTFFSLNITICMDIYVYLYLCVLVYFLQKIQRDPVVTTPDPPPLVTNVTTPKLTNAL